MALDLGSNSAPTRYLLFLEKNKEKTTVAIDLGSNSVPALYDQSSPTRPKTSRDRPGTMQAATSHPWDGQGPNVKSRKRQLAVYTAGATSDQI